MRYRTAVLLSLSLVLAGCKSEQPTEIVVSVATNMRVPDDLDWLGFSASYGGETKFSHKYDMSGAKPEVSLPATMTLVAGSDTSQPVTITITAGKGMSVDTPVVQRKATLSWVPHQTLLLRVNLTANCAFVVCQDGKTCIDGGCKDPSIDASTLPRYSADAAFARLDAAVSERSIGPDARRDLAVDDLRTGDARVDGRAPEVGTAAIKIAPASYAFPSTVVGQSSVTQAFMVTNTGSATSGIPTPTLSGSDASQFTIASNGCAVGLAPQATCTVEVKLAPSSAGAKSASLDVTASPGGTASAALSGSALAPGALTLSPPQHAFPGTLVGQSSVAQTFIVTNTGGVATGIPTSTLSGSGANQFTISSNGCTVGLGPGATCNVQVKFAPTSAGAKAASLDVTASPGGTTSAALTGTGLAPAALTISPASYTFPSIVVGQSGLAQTFTVTNTGGVATGIPTPALTGTGASQFIIVNNGCTAGLAPNGTCDVQVRFAPTSAAAKSASLEVTATPGGTASAALGATGLPPGALEISPASHTFASTVIGQSSVAQTFTVTNTGGGATGVPTPTLSGTYASQFKVTSNGCTATLGPGATCPVQVQFAPTSPGTKSASLDVTASPGGTASAPLTGTAQSPATLTTSTSTQSFGNLEVGVQSTTFTWTINNTGAVASGTPSLSNGNPAEVIVTSNGCTAPLPGGGSCDIVLAFKPSGGGARNGALTLSASPGGSVLLTATATGLWRLTVTRSGTGTGTVTTSPVGISCGSTCTALFGHNQSVTLQARTLNGQSSHFSGWSGDCSGSFRDCTVVVSQSRSVTASFSTNTTNLAFLSSGTFNSNLGGVAQYDAQCNALATAAGINNAGGTAFVAWISTGASTAASRLTATGGFVRLDDRPFALTRADLLAGKILNPLNVNENGQKISGDASTYTSTGSDGTARQTSPCANWTSTSGGVDVGRIVGGPGIWTVGWAAGCGAQNRIYCFQNTSGTAAAAPGTPPSGAKYAYYTSAMWVPGSGITNADAWCNSHKPAGFGTRTFKALLSTTAAAASTIVNTSASYYRPDKVFIATGQTIAAGGQLESGIWLRSDGTYNEGEVQAFTGSSSIGSTGAASQNCSSWTTTSGTVVKGEVNTVNGSYWSAYSNVSCASQHIYCIEP